MNGPPTTMIGEFAKKPAESSIAEGNLAEFPIFVLTNHEARPEALEAYSKTINLGTDVVEGVARTRTVVVNAMPAHGFPTMFASLVLHAIFEQARNQGLASGEAHGTVSAAPARRTLPSLPHEACKSFTD